MGIKATELQATTAPKVTDTLLVANSAAGTGQLSLAQAAAFLGGEMVKEDNPVGAALSSKAAIKVPEPIPFPFSENFQQYQYCYYTKDQFGRVEVIIGMAETKKAISAGQSQIIGILPEGFRPYGQIYGTGWAGDDRAGLQTFINSDGALRFTSYEVLNAGTRFYFQVSYTAHR